MGGGEQGEGILSSVKDEAKNGLVREWQHWLLKNLLEDIAFANVLGEISQDNTTKLFHAYKSETEMLFAHSSGKPFSALRYEGKFYMAFERKEGIVCREVRLSPLEEETILGMNYAYLEKMTVGAGNDMVVKKEDLSSFHPVGVVFLPKLTHLGYPQYIPQKEYQYAYITSEWELS